MDTNDIVIKGSRSTVILHVLRTHHNSYECPNNRLSRASHYLSLMSFTFMARISFLINGSPELPNIGSHELPDYGSYELLYLNSKLLRNVLRSLPERFSIKVIAIEKAKDMDSFKIDELVGSLQNFKLNLDESKKVESSSLKLPDRQREVLSELLKDIIWLSMSGSR
ncbi:hypothetical protein Gotri_028215 [Gossypium trilobum]|uniref:Uncharacterized protein n=1 Tax=Gossypium trilobum TaxID=34281 RepID=A0A7J9FQU8_9ROSI|nr:hypothetical protein [Gossypium trilobum]